ncbi:MAG: zinc-binding dehydrogenase, partial [Bdellovibrionales bacterium]|nr:zinc-binding dehydrogenase [Bdellovibrionales bacterium]
ATSGPCKPGDRVVVNPGFLRPGPEDEWIKRGEECLSPRFGIIGEHRAGGFAEYAVVPAENLHPIPDARSYVEAAAPLLVGLTAYRMLRTRAKLAPGETVAIVGSGGGVNSISIGLAQHFGAAQVIVVAGSEEKAEKAKTLGADETILYRSCPEWGREIRRLTGGRGVDVVVDNVGRASFAQSLQAVARGGRIVTVGNTTGPHIELDNRLLFLKQVSLLGSTMGTANEFGELLSLLWQGEVTPIVDCMLPLSEGRSAYRLLEENRQFGKVVLTL